MTVPKRKMKTENTMVDIPTLSAGAVPADILDVYGVPKPSGYLSLYASGDGSAGTLMASMPTGADSSAGGVPGAPQNPICSNHHLEDKSNNKREPS